MIIRFLLCRQTQNKDLHFALSSRRISLVGNRQMRSLLCFILTFVIMQLSHWNDFATRSELYAADTIDVFHENPAMSVPQSAVYPPPNSPSTFHPAWQSNLMPFPGSWPKDRHLAHHYSWIADLHKVYRVVIFLCDNIHIWIHTHSCAYPQACRLSTSFILIIFVQHALLIKSQKSIRYNDKLMHY